MRLLHKILPVLLMLSLSAAAPAALTASSVQAAEIRASVCGTFTNAFAAVKKAFEQKYPGDEVVLSFGASNPLLRQIEQGAPADVFVSADVETMDQAVSKKLADPATRRDIARGSMVIIQPKDSTDKITSLKDLERGSVKRIAVCNPQTTPAGRYTQKVLSKQNLWDTLSPRFVQAATVRQAVDYAARGEVDAAFVCRTDAARMLDRVSIAMTVPTPKPIVFPAACALTGKNPEGGKRFLDFVSSPEGQKIIAGFGYEKP